MMELDNVSETLLTLWLLLSNAAISAAAHAGTGFSTSVTGQVRLYRVHTTQVAPQNELSYALATGRQLHEQQSILMLHRNRDLLVRSGPP